MRKRNPLNRVDRTHSGDRTAPSKIFMPQLSYGIIVGL
jgi:hypothetical protein